MKVGKNPAYPAALEVLKAQAATPPPRFTPVKVSQKRDCTGTPDG
jgi:hypothetical protein